MIEPTRCPFKRTLVRIVVGLLAAMAGWLVWEWIRFPDIQRLATERPSTTAFMEQRKRDLRKQGKDDELRWRWVSYASISPSLRRAVLVAEDDGFYDHEGVDVKALKEAFERNWKRGRITHGGSTITQQLAKNLYLSPSRNPLRKVREYFIARSLEKHLSKKRILEIYLNVVELGERVYGAEAASRQYFGKPASGLTASEAALLAGALPNPRIMNPGKPNQRLRNRQRMILSRMRRWGYLLEREVLAEKRPEPAAPEAVAEPEPEETEPAPDVEAPPDTTTAAEEPAPEPPPSETAPAPETELPPEGGTVDPTTTGTERE